MRITGMNDAQTKAVRMAVIIVAIANLAYFVIEFFMAQKIGSVSLFADSADFFEDASVNFLIALALGWSARLRARTGMVLALVLLFPAAAFLWTAWSKFHTFTPPAPWLLSATGLGALAVNLGCAYLLAKFRHHKGSLTKAAFLSARNDAVANIAIMGAGAMTLVWPSAWPDLIVGFGIAWMNLDSAREIWQAARNEHKGGAEP